jgi:dipeptidyl aminopeptidase/acylaminoacyl peptidase
VPASPFKRAIVFLLLLGLAGCSKPSPSGVGGPAVATAPGAPAASKLPPATPGLELQQEDYGAARGKFRTNLLRKGPAPQRWQPAKAPPGVLEVEYRSGGLKLKAWTHRPAGDPASKHPAVLYLHGGWAFGEDDWEQAQPLRDAGFVVMVPLLRGENGQPGNFSMFYDEIDDVLAAAEHLAGLGWVDAKRLYVAGHSAGGTLAMLAAMTSDRFRAAAPVSGSPDRIAFVRSGYQDAVPFDARDVREFQVRSPVAYATSFKCPARLYYGSEEDYFDAETRRTALLAKGKGLDVEAVVVPGDHMGCVPEALKRAVEFFRSK